MSNYCPTCKNFKESEIICQDCGTYLLEKATKICSKCGKESRVDLHECIYCGEFYEASTYTFKIGRTTKENGSELDNETGNDGETVETSQVVAERMTLGDILFSFEGRLSRSDYWRRAFPILLPIGILVNIIMFFEFESAGHQGPFSIILGLISLWPSLAVLIKRLHDRDRSGWFILTLLIPFLNIVFVIWLIIEVWFLKGIEGENRFGPEPFRVS